MQQQSHWHVADVLILFRLPVMEMFLGWCEKDTSPLKLSPSSKALQRQTTKETAYILLRHVDIVMFRICMSHKWLNSNMMLHTQQWLGGGGGEQGDFCCSWAAGTEICCYGNEGRAPPLRSHLQRTNLCHQFLTHSSPCSTNATVSTHTCGPRSYN